ncbi:unnamed protein product, partial [Prorocentrum cordatum]
DFLCELKHVFTTKDKRCVKFQATSEGNRNPVVRMHADGGRVSLGAVSFGGMSPITVWRGAMMIAQEIEDGTLQCNKDDITVRK